MLLKIPLLTIMATPIIDVIYKIKDSQLDLRLVNHISIIAEQYISYPKNYTMTVVVVNTSTMRRLNHKYRLLDKPTDVLSFPYDTHTGEIVICEPIAKQEARLKQITLQTEFQWLLIHGILHLLGYDHESVEDAKVMRPLERTILSAA